MNAILRLSVLLAVVLAGCASPLMKPVEGSAAAPSKPPPGKAEVVFMRPSSVGGAVQSTVYDLDPAGDKFLGVVSSSTKLRYETEPGEHLFMVIGESADFMAAHLDADKTYYALVSPRIGVWKARFSLLPIRKAQLAGEEFEDWQNSTKFVVNTPDSHQWAKENWASIQSKKIEYLPKWTAKSIADKSERTLWAQDGL